MNQIRAATPTSAASDRPGPNSGGDKLSFARQYLDLVCSAFHDGIYYATLLRPFLDVPVGATWEDIERLSFSAGLAGRTGWSSPKPDESQLCIMRGCLSPLHLSKIAFKLHIRPEFLVGHLGTAVTRPSTGAWPVRPALPSERGGMGHVRFITLGCNIRQADRFDFSAMPQRRKRCRERTEHLDWRVQLEGRYGETRVRDVHLHNPRYFSVEQLVSFYFARSNQSGSRDWTGVLITDNGRSLAHQYHLPWQDYGDSSGIKSCFMPHSLSRSSASDQSNHTTQTVRQGTNADFYTFDPVQEMDWMNQVGTSTIKQEPYLLVSRILQLAAYSIAKVICVMEEDVTTCQQIDEDLSAIASAQLRFELVLLDRFRVYVLDNLEILRCQASVLKSDPSPAVISSGLDRFFDDLNRDYGFLLARIDSLRSRCDTVTTTLLSTMSILESQKSIEQSSQVNKLTKLAFVYIPLSFVASIFGMNVKEIQRNPPLWVFLATAISFTLLSIFVASWQEIKALIFQ